MSEIRAVLPNGDIFSLRNGRIFDPASDIRSINFDIDTQLILRQIDHIEAKHLNRNITLSEFDAKVFEEVFDLIKNKGNYTLYVKK